jgi:superfamily II RNA helicase
MITTTHFDSSNDLHNWKLVNTSPLGKFLTPGATLSNEAILDAFVSFVSDSKLTLYPAQEEAALELLGGNHVVLATPTGSGKSLVATAFHFQAMAQGKRSFYTCPIKALVNEKFFALCEVFGAENVGMMTGDASVNKEAPIICCTAEVLSNLSIVNLSLFAECVVMDEFHYYGDKERGVAWQVPLLALPETQFLLMSATLGDMTSISTQLTAVTKRQVSEVRHAERPVPLEMSYSEVPLHEAVSQLLTTGKSPVYLVNFTQRAAAEEAQSLMSIDVCTKEEKQKIKDALVGMRFDTPFGKELKRLLAHGIGLHHAGLLPKYRRLVERLSQLGLLKVISGTDTLGVGVNVPIRTVLFTQLCKYNGEKTTLLPVRDFHQISGRAGRKGFDTVGYVMAQAPAHIIENIRLNQKKNEGKKNVTLQKAPEKGFVHWDKQTFERLQVSLPEKLESSFVVHHGLIVSLLKAWEGSSKSGYKKLVELIFLSHSSPVMKQRLLKQARVLTRALVDAHIVVHKSKDATGPASLQVASELQPDFSLHHTLSLFVLEAMPKFDASLPDYALDVLSLTESILENPDPVLYSQRDRAKDKKMQELKAQGVEYDKRIEELEKVEYPKPNSEFIYGAFDDFSGRHPWVGQENVRPKSVAREMFETCAAFNEYVRDYGLQRSEGVLLRYLSQSYKTLIQNVPNAMEDERLADIAAYLETTLKQTDSSLLEEWTQMQNPSSPRAIVESPEKKQTIDFTRNPKALMAKVRAEMHQLVARLARKSHDDILDKLASTAALTKEALELSMAEFWKCHQSIDVTPRARQPQLTTMTALDDGRSVVRHEILDESETSEWFIEGIIDVRDSAAATSGSKAESQATALVQVRYIGR